MEIITVVMVVLEALNELLHVKHLEHFQVRGKWNINISYCYWTNFATFKNSWFPYYYFFWLRWVFVAVCGLSLVEVRGLLIVVSTLVAEHGL